MPRSPSLGAGVLPDAIEREQIDFKEEAGRRGPRGTLTVGAPHNEEAARHLANEVACMANTPGGGAIVVGVEDRSGRLLGAALDAEWFRHRVYEHVGVAPGVKERVVQGIRLLVLYIAQARDRSRTLAIASAGARAATAPRLTAPNGG